MSISLTVKECDPVDVGRNVIRIDRESMKMIGVTEGDLVEVAGHRGSTYAGCLPVSSKDVGKGIVLLDRILETNASVQTGDILTVRKVGSYDAQKVILMPAGSCVRSRWNRKLTLKTTSG